jgi:transposase
MNSKLHAVCDGEGRPLVVVLSEGQMSGLQGSGADVGRLALRQGDVWMTR